MYGRINGNRGATEGGISSIRGRQFRKPEPDYANKLHMVIKETWTTHCPLDKKFLIVILMEVGFEEVNDHVISTIKLYMFLFVCNSLSYNIRNNVFELSYNIRNNVFEANFQFFY